jgi:hypothetical protein
MALHGARAEAYLSCERHGHLAGWDDGFPVPALEIRETIVRHICEARPPDELVERHVQRIRAHLAETGTWITAWRKVDPADQVGEAAARDTRKWRLIYPSR